MKKIVLGKSGIEVTEFCFGALNIGPLQKNMSFKEGGEIISYALESGVNFIDTAQIYRTYQHIRYEIKKTGITPIISSKSTASTYEDMQNAIEEALTEMDVEKIDIFFLHAGLVSENVFEERAGAFKCLMDYREKGTLKAIGISTHAVDVVHKASTVPEVDIVFPIINVTGKGILRGTTAQMEEAINSCHDNNKGIVLMKILAGGSLIPEYQSAMDYAKQFSAERFCISMGILKKEELDMNLKCLSGQDISKELSLNPINTKEFFIAKLLCTRCMECQKVCHSDAIYGGGNDFVKIDQEKCIKCGYCVGACEQLAIRLI